LYFSHAAGWINPIIRGFQDRTGIHVHQASTRTSIETEGTSIDQQKDIGIKFASKSGLEYQLYEDNGKLGFKIDMTETPSNTGRG